MTPRAAASRYARALFDVVVAERADAEQVGRDLTAFSDLLRENDALSRVLMNPAVPTPKKRGIVEQLLARDGSMSPFAARLLLLLAERGRLALLGDIISSFNDRLMEHRKVVRAEVTTAIPLPEDRLRMLEAGLAAATGRQVQVSPRVDPSILGGAVARIRSTVFDGSIARQLEKMRDALASAGE